MPVQLAHALKAFNSRVALYIRQSRTVIRLQIAAMLEFIALLTDALSGIAKRDPWTFWHQHKFRSHGTQVGIIRHIAARQNSKV